MLSCSAHGRFIPAVTPIPSLWGHHIPRWLHPASSHWEGQKGTFSPSSQAGLQSSTSPQQRGCSVCGHSKALNTSLSFTACFIPGFFSHSEDFPHLFLH